MFVAMIVPLNVQPQEMARSFDIVAPDPSSLIEALRSVGYNLPTAVADIIDNSISAGARYVELHFHWAGRDSSVVVVDDGSGMDETELRTAMKPGSRSPLEMREEGDLGRFGLGLKTASFSQCRNLCVVSKRKGGKEHVRTWDLDEVARTGEWRLLTKPSAAAQRWMTNRTPMAHGTAIIWSHLDRLVGDVGVNDRRAHERFNRAVEEVRWHLGLVFHRFMEERKLKISVNSVPVKAWDPFHRSGRNPSYATPEEVIPVGQGRVAVQGHVLPHRDSMPADEWEELAGPHGWLAHQGFYIYRDKRLLVHGDWLGLGLTRPWTAQEHYGLARIRVDIGNDADQDWHLDIKKSRARPPAIVADRLTALAEEVRERARRVFAHRADHGKKARPAEEPERTWVSVKLGTRNAYRINRDHSAVRMLLEAQAGHKGELATLLRLLEETVPVERIWLDTADDPHNAAIPYDNVDVEELKQDMRRVRDLLIANGVNQRTATESLKGMVPFDRYPKLITEL
jgi:hypothetical protein